MGITYMPTAASNYLHCCCLQDKIINYLVIGGCSKDICYAWSQKTYIELLLKLYVELLSFHALSQLLSQTQLYFQH